MKDSGYRLPDEITGHEIDYVCIPYPDDRMYRIALWGQLLALTRWWNWQKDGTARGSQAAAYWFSILQPAYDAWMRGERCDMKCCGVTYNLFLQINIDVVENNVTIWNDNDINIYIDCNYDGTPEDDYRDTALCFGITMIAYALKAALESMLVGGDDDDTLLNNAANAMVGFIASTLDQLALGASASGMPVAFAIADVLKSFLPDIKSARQDGYVVPDDALDAWICCMYSALSGSTQNKTLWQSATSACSGAFDTGKPLLDTLFRSLVVQITGSNGFYASFLSYVQQGFDLAEAGLIENDCCAPQPLKTCFDFVASDEGWTVNPDAPGTVYYDSIGWRAGDETSGVTRSREAGIGYVVPYGGTWTGVEITVWYREGTAYPPDTQFYADQPLPVERRSIFDDSVIRTYTIMFDDPKVISVGTRVRIGVRTDQRCCNTSAGFNGAATIKGVCLIGNFSV